MILAFQLSSKRTKQLVDQKVIDSVKQKKDVDSITFFCHFHQTIVLVKIFLCNLIYIRIFPHLCSQFPPCHNSHQAPQYIAKFGWTLGTPLDPSKESEVFTITKTSFAFPHCTANHTKRTDTPAHSKEVPANYSSSYLNLHYYILSHKRLLVSPKNAQETCAQWHILVISVLMKSEGRGSQV